MRTPAAVVTAIFLTATCLASPVDLTHLLQAAGIAAPWYVERVDVDGNRFAYLVRAYSAPRQISLDACLADGEELTIDTAGNVTQRRPLRLFAFRSCTGISPDDMDLAEGIKNEAFVAKTAAVILSVIRTGAAPGVKVIIEDDEARAAARYLDPTKLSFPEWKEHSARFTFFSPQSCGQMIAVEYDDEAGSLTMQYSGDLDCIDSQGNPVRCCCTP